MKRTYFSENSVFSVYIKVFWHINAYYFELFKCILIRTLVMVDGFEQDNFGGFVLVSTTTLHHICCSYWPKSSPFFLSPPMEWKITACLPGIVYFINITKKGVGWRRPSRHDKYNSS